MSGYITIKLRRGTAAQWTATNPTLSEGEMGLETDTRKFKVGDGLTAWTGLSYWQTGGGGGVDNFIDLLDTPASYSGQALKLVRVNAAATGLEFWTLSIAAGDLPTGIDAAKIADGSVSNAEFQYLNGVTSAIQSQIDGKAATNHSHVIGDVTGLQTALDGKAATSHTHVIADVTGLQTALDGKAASSHTHSIADVTNLQTTLDGKQDEAVVVSTNQTAVNDGYYISVASATFTDPSPTEGKGFIVFVRNGTATIGGTAYSTAGSLIYRVYHSGAWANYNIGVQDLSSYLTSSNITQTITNGVTDKAPSEDAVYDALALKASSTFIDCIAGVIETPANKDYRVVVKAPFAGTINETTTISASGTCTATFKVNTTALGGTANSVSNSEQSQTHSSSNTFVAGDDIVITVSSNSSCSMMSFSIKVTRSI